ncbi:unnamed protein product [Didymodactylos carnosus]|uniref:Nuclear receptor domain-containing protein n=1 Tax=Didymodactylos carnosus TaxID=1234261 RepID=A0A816BYT2_9BILA|nr:unnamed protein product [Didymodactylos carnosus]CAF4504181.1 unnamed protein product [Didymodactylos carnosus]
MDENFDQAALMSGNYYPKSISSDDENDGCFSIHQQEFADLQLLSSAYSTTSSAFAESIEISKIIDEIERIEDDWSDHIGEEEKQINDHTKHKERKVESSKKNLKCFVCGAKALGYNFDQISCESCKAFFRRNALRNMSDLKCRFSDHCEVTVASRRYCTYCRLQKCFVVGMRKEWIRSEEQKNIKRHQTEKNRQLKNLTYNNNGQIIHTLSLLSNDKSSLTQDDWRHLNNIVGLHEQKVKPIVFNRHSIKTTTVNDFVNNKTVWVQQLASYFKQIPEFQQLNISDQIVLFKYNFRTLVPINIALVKHILASMLPPRTADHTSFMISVHGEELYRKMQENIHTFSLFQHDPVIIKLMLIIIKKVFCLLVRLNKLLVIQALFIYHFSYI